MKKRPRRTLWGKRRGLGWGPLYTKRDKIRLGNLWGRRKR